MHVVLLFTSMQATSEHSPTTTQTRMQVATASGVSRDVLRGLEKSGVFDPSAYLVIDALIAKVISVAGASRKPGDRSVTDRDLEIAQLLRAQVLTNRTSPNELLILVDGLGVELKSSLVGLASKKYRGCALTVIPVGYYLGHLLLGESI